MAIVVVGMALAAWVASSAFGTLPADAIPFSAALAYALWVGLIALSFGSLALALSQLVGRGRWRPGIAGALLLGGWICPKLPGDGRRLPAHRGPHPMGLDARPSAAGRPDRMAARWSSPALVVVVLLAIGVEAFARRDLGEVTSLPTPGLPTATLGLREPVGRSLGDRLPIALAWGLGIGAFGLMLAAISAIAADALGSSPDMRDLLDRIFPLFDVGTAGGFLQLMVQILYIVAGFAAATLVAGWASDETSGRLEMLLTTPVRRGTWAIRSGVGVLLAIGVMTLVIGIGIGIGAMAAGSDADHPDAGHAGPGCVRRCARGNRRRRRWLPGVLGWPRPSRWWSS